MGKPPNVALIKALREQTGAGVMDCKEALDKSKNDLDQAVRYLEERGCAAALKKADRTAREGLVTAYIHHGGRLGVLLEVNCETDFVARTDQFQALVKDLALQIAGADPPPRYVSRTEVPPEELALLLKEVGADGAEALYRTVSLLDQPCIKDPSLTVQEMIARRIATLGEHIQVRRFTRYALGKAYD